MHQEAQFVAHNKEGAEEALVALQRRAAAVEAGPEGAGVCLVRHEVVALLGPRGRPRAVQRVRVACGRRVEHVDAAPVRHLSKQTLILLALEICKM